MNENQCLTPCGKCLSEQTICLTHCTFGDEPLNLEMKQRFANESGSFITHPLVKLAMEEFADNMGFKLEGLPLYGLKKLGCVIAMVTAAAVRRIDILELTLTDEEERLVHVMKIGSLAEMVKNDSENNS